MHHFKKRTLQKSFPQSGRARMFPQAPLWLSMFLIYASYFMLFVAEFCLLVFYFVTFMCMLYFS